MTDLQVGDEVYVLHPQQIELGCNSIGGTITVIEGDAAVLDADVTWPYRQGPGGVSSTKLVSPVQLSDLRRRIGTPISQLSGRPGHDGFSAFRDLAASWGYD